MTEKKIAVCELKDPPVNRVEVRGTDTIKGKGVFATEDIPMGEIVCYYPTDFIGNTSGVIKPQNQADYDILREISQYVIPLKKAPICGITMAIDADAFPFCGHRINDGAAILSYQHTKKQSKMAMEAYRQVSKVAQNVRFVYFTKGELGLGVYRDRKCVVVISKKDIKKGQELFISYGPRFWYDYLAYNTGQGKVLVKEQHDPIISKVTV